MEPDGNITTLELAVEGMHCQSCVLLIEETLNGDPTIRTVSVDLESARATVTYERGASSVDAVCATLTSLGYPAQFAVDDPGS
jgi:copper chaperone